MIKIKQLLMKTFLRKILFPKYVKDFKIERISEVLFEVTTTTLNGNTTKKIITPTDRFRFIYKLSNIAEINELGKYQSNIIDGNKYTKEVALQAINAIGEYAHFVDSWKPVVLLEQDDCCIYLKNDSIIFKRTTETDSTKDEYIFELEGLDEVIKAFGNAVSSIYRPGEPEVLSSIEEEMVFSEVSSIGDEVLNKNSVLEKVETRIIPHKETKTITIVNSTRFTDIEFLETDVVSLSKILQKIRMYKDEINEELDRNKKSE